MKQRRAGPLLKAPARIVTLAQELLWKTSPPAFAFYAALAAHVGSHASPRKLWKQTKNSAASAADRSETRHNSNALRAASSFRLVLLPCVSWTYGARAWTLRGSFRMASPPRDGLGNGVPHAGSSGSRDNQHATQLFVFGRRECVLRSHGSADKPRKCGWRCRCQVRRENASKGPGL